MSDTASEHTTSRSQRRVGRSVAAVVAGVLSVFILTSIVDAVLHATGVYPPVPQRMADTLFWLALTYRIAFNVVGGWVTARLAPDRPIRHALILGWIGVIAATVGGIALWDRGPAWYNLAVIAVAIPSVWLGARLFLRSRSHSE